jgi:DNA-binding transcriptional MerR regulator
VTARAGADATLVEGLVRAGLLIPHHVDAEGTARFTPADVEALGQGLRLLEAGLPLGELLALATRADAALSELADAAVEAFLRFVRDPMIDRVDEDATADRLVAAYATMLPATAAVVVHHFRRRVLTSAARRLSEVGPDAIP